MHIDCDSLSLSLSLLLPSLSPAGHRGADPELWTDAISVAYWATSSTQLRHAPGESNEHAGKIPYTFGSGSGGGVSACVCVRVYECVSLGGVCL